MLNYVEYADLVVNGAERTYAFSLYRSRLYVLRYDSLRLARNFSLTVGPCGNPRNVPIDLAQHHAMGVFWGIHVPFLVSFITVCYVGVPLVYVGAAVCGATAGLFWILRRVRKTRRKIPIFPVRARSNPSE